MNPFKIFPGTNSEPLALEINKFIASVLPTMQMSQEDDKAHSYFDQCNQEINRLNYLLTHPLNAKKLYKKACKLQKEYNQALQTEQGRWLDSEGDFLAGTQIIKHLAQRKRQFNEALELSNLFDKKKLIIEQYLSLEPWEPIFKQAREKNCLTQMKRLRLDWIGQEQFVYYDSEDLYGLLKELKDFYWFMNLMHSIKTENAIILKVLKDNKLAFKNLKKQIQAAIAWRIHAASLRGNLWFDDHLWALEYSIHQLLGTPLPSDDKILSEKLNPSILKVFIKNIQKAQHKIDRDKWFESRWILNSQKIYPIGVVVTHDLELIPQDLLDYIPEQRNSTDGISSILPDYFLRYFYFRGASPQNRLEKYLKKKMIQSPYELIVFLNEAFYQINKLAQDLSTQTDIVLQKLILSPGFKSALWFPEIIEKERQRITQFQYNHWFAKSLDWLHRTFLGNKTQAFCQAWIQILDNLENKLRLQIKAIISRLVLDFDRILAEELKGSIFNYSKNLLNDLSFLVDCYASGRIKKRFQNLITPSYLFTKFQFFESTAPYETYSMHHAINKNIILVFLRYAALYWGPEESKAAQAVASLLLGDFPKNEAEDAQLENTLGAWFSTSADEADKHGQVMHFLNSLGCDYLVKTGMRSNRLAERFLKKYAVEAFEVWQKERESALSEKYFLLIGLFSKVAGTELDREAQQYQKIEPAFIDDLRRDQSRNNYIAALGEAFKAYLQLYDGSNGHYAELVIHLGGAFSAQNDLY